MINLLRSDFYRLFRSKAFYICVVIWTFLFAIGAFLAKWLNDIVAKSQNIDTVPELSFHSGIAYGLTVFNDSNMSLFMAIYIAIFVTAEFTHGTMKNSVSKGFSKIQIYLSKFITMSGAVYLTMLILFLSGLITGTIVSGNFLDTSEDFAIKAIGMIGMELLLYAAFTSVFVMIAMIIRNNGGTIAVNIIGMLFAPFIYQLIDVFFSPAKSFSQYSLQNNIIFAHYNIEKTSGDILTTILVGVVFLVVSMTIGLFTFKNTDIK